jgi:hypothetical protein
MQEQFIQNKDWLKANLVARKLYLWILTGIEAKAALQEI